MLRDALRDDPEHAALLALSAREGANPARVQAAGGNTSIKGGDTLWIKASGTWLAEAERREILVPVALGALRAALEVGDPAAEKAQAFVVAEANPGGLRPSIETTVHAAMPRRVVVHVHCVETIAHAVLADAEARLGERLDGFRWTWIPYVRPGLPLAGEILRRRESDSDVLVLGNHGLVVAADTVAEADQLLEAVCARLALPVRPAGTPAVDALASLAAGGGYRLPEDPRCHDVALEDGALRFAQGGSPYPDHVIFLGAGSRIAADGETAATIAASAATPPPAILFPGLGTLVRDGADRAVEPMLRCLGDVGRRVPPDGTPRYLSGADEHALLNWDAEAYRKTLDRER